MIDSKIISDFTRETSALGIDLSPEQAEQFSDLYRLLIEKNAVMNLTAITEEREVFFKHFYDSLTLVKSKEARSALECSGKICDLGTGAGFPGLPLKICFPQVKITFVDSVNKKLLYIEETAGKLGLSDGIILCHSRAEDLGHDKASRETFDLVTSRAVANLTTLSEYCLPLVKTGGTFVSLKGDPGETDHELSAAERALTILGGKVVDRQVFDLPYEFGGRTLLTIAKVKGTPAKYPRKAGLPSKEPLH